MRAKPALPERVRSMEGLGVSAGADALVNRRMADSTPIALLLASESRLALLALELPGRG